ncbi:MAG: hypothetical protein GY793_08550 [Proteobacteria bacterium]|nr:hypothetical protein [Pseudomonadota bacterium]
MKFYKTTYTQSIDRFFNQNMVDYKFQLGREYYCFYSDYGMNRQIVAVVVIYKISDDYFLDFAIDKSSHRRFFTKGILKNLYDIIFHKAEFMFAETINSKSNGVLTKIGFREYNENTFILSKQALKGTKWQKIISQI